MVKEWDGAAHLVGRMSVLLGLVLVAVGCGKYALLLVQSHRGAEAMATIDASTQRTMSTGGWVDLSWQDRGGGARYAFNVPVTSGLGRKLRLGSTLSRAAVKIRYDTDNAQSGVMIVEDVPEQIKSTAALAIAGFLAMSAGSVIILGTLLLGHAAASDAGGPSGQE